MPSSPFSRSSVKASAASIARWRSFFGNIGSMTRSTLSSVLNSANQPQLWCGAFLLVPTVLGSCRNSSSMPTPFGFFATGFSAASTISGTIVVRAQYEILLMWNGDHIGSTGTARQLSTP
jgi:hypothetical protein